LTQEEALHMSQGRVISIHVARTGCAPMETIGSARAVAGRGLEGDRYYEKLGTYSGRPGSGRAVTLIESEALEALKRDYGVDIEAAQARRNIVTHAVALNHLVGREFTIGAIRLRGMRLCEPCAHLEKLTASGTPRGLIHRGGLRADVLSSGIIQIGDPITELAAML
jgi:MOSC domain-containing protein YiiM